MSDNPNNLSQFWQELKRRKVLRVVTVYAAAAFVILQLVEILAPSLRLPEWTMNFILVLLIVGFIIAVILSWIYDVHPEGGMVKTEPANRAEKIDVPKSSNGWKIASFISFIVIVGLIILNILPRNDKSETDESIEKSIAILPFKNISPDSSNQYLLDGIMEAVLNYLTKVENVRVIASTSVQQYRGTNKTISEIGEELNVNFILEGSGQKYEENFRLTTKLSDTKNSILIWSNPYDREVRDILDVQSEIASRIVRELQAELNSKEIETLNSKPTFSNQAYENYLKAQKLSVFDPQTAVSLLDDAIKIDPLFVDAYVQLSDVHMNRTNVVIGEISSNEALSAALPPLLKAFEIEPEHAGVHKQLGMIKYWLQWDFNGAIDEFKKAYELSGNPNHLSISIFIQNRRFDEALEIAALRRDYDPLNTYYGRIIAHLYSGEPEKALVLWNEQSELSQSTGGGWAGRIHMALKHYDQAIEHFNIAIRNKRIPFFLSDLAICYKRNGENEKTLDILNELIDRYNLGEQGCIAFMVGKIYSGIGEAELALEWLEKAYQDHEVEMIWLYVDPAFESLHDNPQYIDLLKKVGFDV